MIRFFLPIFLAVFQACFTVLFASNPASTKYVDEANQALLSYVDEANQALIKYVNQSIANVELKNKNTQNNAETNKALMAYVDEAKRALITYVNQSIANVDLNNKGMQSNINDTNQSLKAYVDEAKKALLSYIDQAIANIPNAGFSNNGPQYNIGDRAQGGIIFWLTSDRRHGLVAATNDLGSLYPWHLETDAKLSGAVGNDLLITVDPSGQIATPGKSNTNLIVSAYGSSSPGYAAYQCTQYSEGGYNDWYLPSLGELGAMAACSAVGLTNNGVYWSSSEYYINSGVGHAWLVLVSSSPEENYDFDTEGHSVRPVRAF